MEKAPIVDSQPGKTSMGLDNLFLQKLEHIQNFSVRQANVLAEAVTLGIWANTYVISDLDRPTPVLNAKKPTEVPTPVFLVREESNCCARLCCPGNQSFLAKVFHAKMEPVAGKTHCGCCYEGHKYEPDLTQPVAMTLEREGCCSRCLGCFVCCDMCAQHMYMHPGEVDVKPGTTVKEEGGYFARTRQPIGAGGFHPQLELYTNETPEAKETPFAYFDGPCLYGGWLGVCFDTIFRISSEPKGSGDLGQIKKNRIKSFKEFCIAALTDVDWFEVNLPDDHAKIGPEQKAAILGTALQLDYMLYENDLPPCYVEPNDKGAIIYCVLCQMFCFGGRIPCEICIPIE
ncbi:uncharacterized protein MONBRDRAFT_24368, partial [Monosiga brevicollis MX1]